jgi:hypothetical protein
MNTTKFLGEGCGSLVIYIIHATEGVSFVLEVAGHIGSHAANAHKSDIFFS